MNILVADQISEAAIQDLRKLGSNVTYDADLSGTELADQMSDVEILIVRSTRVNENIITKSDKLSLIIRAGSGVNTIDLHTASIHGVHVANCPGMNTDAVAELTIGLLAAADRQIVNATRDLREGHWRKKHYADARGLKHRTLGLLGFGTIGRTVAKMAREGLNMKVIAWSRSLNDAVANHFGVERCEDPKEIAKQSDAVSVHLSATDETHHLVDEEFFDLMKNGAVFINTSRGQIVDSNALQQAINTKDLKVGLDVFEDEPTSTDDQFEQTKLAQKATCTPHIGASTQQASEAIANAVVDIVRSYIQTGRPINTINVRRKSSDSISLLVRHYNEVGVLANVLNILRHEDVNVEEMENTIFEEGQAATCTMWLDSEPTPDMLNKIREDDHIIQVVLQRSSSDS